MMRSQRSNYSTEKSERLEARLSKSQKELIQHAADLCGRSLTDFVIQASQDAANKITQEHHIIRLTADESKRFVDILVNPPEPNKALKAAAKRHAKVKKGDSQ